LCVATLIASAVSLAHSAGYPGNALLSVYKEFLFKVNKALPSSSVIGDALAAK
jgi:hypothetical protein